MTTLDQICLNIVDCEHKTAPIQESGIPLIRTTDIKRGVINFRDANKVSEETYKTWTQRLEPKFNDLILAREAPVGEIGIIPERRKACLGQRTVLIRPNPHKVHPHYLLYLMLSREVQHEMKTRAAGSTVEHLNMSDIRELKLPNLPPFEVQKQVGDTLANLDRKIENLRKQNETLEAIAQTLFKHWFVDFEFPNKDGKPYRSSGGVMEQSELGEIPAGWHVGKLEDIGKNIRDGISKDEIQPDMNYIALEHMPRKQIALDAWGTGADIASNKIIFRKGTILFGKLRPYFHKVGVAFISGICSTDILVLDSKREELFSFLLMILSNDEFIKYVSLASEGTRMPRTSWEYMKEYSICIPDNSVISAFNDLVEASINKIENNIFQIQTLTKIRDVLLPQLMSSKLPIKN